ncbi:hypothetical protein J4410_05690, partial [Candidatus Woesearchaeota archaeon]|nr:hypothetical protein [Candidatus Woesearchaeota archaeon]
NDCPAGYKPICYPKAPEAQGTGLSSTDCSKQNSTAALNLSNIDNAHAASKLLTSLDTTYAQIHKISGESFTLSSPQRIGVVTANVCGNGTTSKSMFMDGTATWEIKLLSSDGRIIQQQPASSTHTKGSCQEISATFDSSQSADKIMISYVDFVPAKCFNGIKDDDEQAIDCGNTECGTCKCDWYFCRPWFDTGRRQGRSAGWTGYGCDGNGNNGCVGSLAERNWGCNPNLITPSYFIRSETPPVDIGNDGDTGGHKYNFPFTKYEYCGKSSPPLQTVSHMSLTSYQQVTGGVLTGDIGYNTPICVQSQYGNMTCTYAKNCIEKEFCLVTLSNGSSNLHLAACDSSPESKAYPQKVCCTLGNTVRQTCLTRPDQTTECKRTCGNDVREPQNDEGVDEACDGNDLPITLCENLVIDGVKPYAAGQLTCSSACSYDTSGCITQTQLERLQELPTSSNCGNKKLEPEFGEECDTRDLGGKKFCSELKDSEGRQVYENDGRELSCFQPGNINACKYDTRNCRGTCGNLKLDPGIEDCDPTIASSLDDTCYGKSPNDKRTWGLITRCNSVCEYDTSGCKEIATANKCRANGVVEWWNGEECDTGSTAPIFIGGNKCTDRGYDSDAALTCSGCKVSTASCGAPPSAGTCGDGKISSPEECDVVTSAVGDEVFAGSNNCNIYNKIGKLGCTAECKIDISVCRETLCGSITGQIEPSEDCDPKATPSMFRPEKDTCEEIGLGFTDKETKNLGCTDRCEFDVTRCPLSVIS